MTAELHEFRPEEVMAYLDGEITGERALALADHLEQCTDCSSLADDFCALSQQLISWKVEPAALAEPTMDPVAVGQEDEELAAVPVPRVSLLPAFLSRPFLQRPWVWALGTCAVMLIVASLSLRMSRVAPNRLVPTDADLPAHAELATKVENAEHGQAHSIGPAPNSGLNTAGMRARGNAVPIDGADAVDNSINGVRATVPPEDLSNFYEKSGKPPVDGKRYLPLLNSQTSTDLSPSIGAAPIPGPNPAAPQMIERTASLSLTVKEIDAARTTLEGIVRQHHGYFAELNTEGRSEAGRTLTASVRVPTVELDGTLTELRKLGQPGEEKQGGEEVSSQYVDLKARLENARHTEKRLTELLTKRAAKLKDVLDVERELAGTREEIERMEAQQRNMEGQVYYAFIDLKLREEYKPALNLAPPAAGIRMRNALVDGYHSAADSALNVVLFFLQAGPSILFWLLLLFFPMRWSWRKLRVVAAQKQSLAGAH